MTRPVPVEDLCLIGAATIRDVLRRIDETAQGVALVIDADRRLISTVTDGDIRRALLLGLTLDVPVQQVIDDPRCHPTRQAVTAPVGTPRDELRRAMQHWQVAQLPLVDEEGRIVGLEVLRDLLGTPTTRENPVFIPAGGLGVRLRPLTADTPKPLLTVGGRPLLEILIEEIAAYGFYNFVLAVNYRADQIERLLGDGSRLAVNIRYVREDEPLGTAGALRLARSELTAPFLIVNGDLLTKVNFEHLFEYHASGGYDLTLAIKQYAHKIPYGMVRVDQDLVVAIEEKPVHTCFVNAGIYVLNPPVAALVPKEGPYDMPDLIRALLDGGGRVGAFPVQEYWLDIGSHADYHRAHRDYPDQFAGGPR